MKVLAMLCGALIVACGSTRPEGSAGQASLRAADGIVRSAPAAWGVPRFAGRPGTADETALAQAVERLLRNGSFGDGVRKGWFPALTQGDGTDLQEPAALRVLAEESHAGKSADEVARDLANPNTPLATLRFKNQLRLFEGDLANADDQTSYTLLFQPILPFALGTNSGGGSAVFFFRPAIPLLVDQPVFNASSGSFEGKTGLGDIAFDVAYGVTEKNGLLWAAGMYGIAPTASSSQLGSGFLSLGPEALLARYEKWGVYGIQPSHVWNVTGWGDGYVSTTQVQLFFVVLPGHGWSVGTQPISSYNWRTSEWTAPLNLYVSKTVVLGATPWKLDVEVNWYFQSPDAIGPQWMIGINIAPVVKNFIAAWIKGH